MVLVKRGLWALLEGSRQSIAVCAISGSLLNVLAFAGSFGVSVPVPVALLCWFLMGLGEVFVLIQVGRAFRGLEARTKIIAVAAATMVAGLGFGVAINLQGTAQILVSTVTFLLAIVFAKLSNSPYDRSEITSDRQVRILSVAGCKSFFVSFVFFT